jgi:hypothetical protein
MVLDEWPVIAEDFNQWVVEDNFCCGCPDWDKVCTPLTPLMYTRFVTVLMLLLLQLQLMKLVPVLLL